MSTLVIKARSIIAKPKYGKLPTLNDGLQIMLDARTLGLTQGASVSAWTATGAGSANERNFTIQQGDWNYPTFDNSARKSVRFDGTAMLMNNNAAGVSLPAASYVVVYKLDSLADVDSVYDRLFTGDAANGYQSVYLKTGSLVMWSLRGGANNIPVDTNWAVGIFVFDGANSKFITSVNNALTANPTDTDPQDRISIGGNINKRTQDGTAMKGNVALFAQYNKALSNDEMQTLLTYYKNEFAV